MVKKTIIILFLLIGLSYAQTPDSTYIKKLESNFADG